MAHLALAISRGYEDFGGEAALILPALAAVGVQAEPVVWDDPSVAWGEFDGVVVRATWTYTARVEAFVDWVDRIAAVVPLANPAAVIRWNSDKRYLGDLSEAGVATIPTTYLRAGSGVRLTDLEVFDAWPELVVKPTVSAGARQSGRFGLDDLEAAQALVDTIHGLGSDVMLQPYLAAVDVEGETDLLVFGDQISHAVAKGGVLALGAGAAPDERLAVDQWHRPTPMTDELIAFAREVLAAVPGRPSLVQARVDSVVDQEGTRRLMELELIEPYLFLSAAPDPAIAAAGYASAVLRWLGQRGSEVGVRP